MTRLPTIDSTRIQKGSTSDTSEKDGTNREACGIQKQRCPKGIGSMVVTKIHFEENLLAFLEIPGRNFCWFVSKKKKTGLVIDNAVTAVATLLSINETRIHFRGKLRHVKSNGNFLQESVVKLKSSL